MGTFPLERAYYHCRSCGAGTVPWDEALGLSRQALTPGARELVCIAGAVDSFAEAADVVLRKLAGLRVSESTVERTSEAAGHDIGQRLAAGETFGASQPWAWHKDAEGKTCAYVSLDLTGLGMQGPDGGAAEGRMAAVGMIYNPVPDDPHQWARPQGRAPQFQARYVAGLEGQASLAEPLRRQAAQVGMDQARAVDRPVRRRGRGGRPAAGELRPGRGRVTAITHLLTQGVLLEDVQYLAGHAEPRTTGLSDRRQKKVTRNIVERISI